MCKIRNFVAEFYGLKLQNYLNCKGSNLIGVKFDRGKKFVAYYIANISNSITTCEYWHYFICKPFVSSFNVACEIVI